MYFRVKLNVCIINVVSAFNVFNFMEPEVEVVVTYQC